MSRLMFYGLALIILCSLAAITFNYDYLFPIACIIVGGGIEYIINRIDILALLDFRNK